MPPANRSRESNDLSAAVPPPSRGAQSGEAEASWNPRTRFLVSLAVSFHVLAVFVGPFTFATQSAPGTGSPFAESLMGPLRWYVDLAFLNHGYFFFAPNPGPSCLVQYRVEFDDGRPSITGQFPDRNEQWPRLLYHRHFMLTEQWNAIFVPAEPPPEVAREPERLAGWRSQRESFELQKRSYEQHLAAKHGGGRVTLTRVEHRPADVFEVLQEGKSLTDTSTYRVLSDEAPTSLPAPLRP